MQNPDAQTASRKRVRLARIWAANRTEFWLFAIAFLWYLPGIAWGLPDGSRPDGIFVWSYDDLSPFPALMDTYHYLGAASGNFLAYPLLHSLTISLCYTPYLLWLALTGGFSRASHLYPFGFADPGAAFRGLTLIARLISLTMAAATVAIAYRIGALLWNRRSGLLAAAGVGVSYPMVYYSKTGNVEVPYLFWSALGFLILATMIRNGKTVSRAMWLGVFAGLSAATKDQAAGLFILMPLILLPWGAEERKSKSPSWLKLEAAFLAALGITYALGSGMILLPHHYLAHLRFLFLRNNRLPFTDPYPMSPAGIAELVSCIPVALFWVFGPVLLAAAAGAMIYAWRQERKTLALVLPAIGYVLLFILPLHYFKLRYIVPVAFIAALFAARGISAILGASPGWTLRKIAVLAIAFAWPAVLSADLEFQMTHDSHDDASRWIAAHVPPNSRIAGCDSGPIFPHPLRQDVHFLYLHAVAPETIVPQLMRERPEFVIAAPDWSGRDGKELSRVCPAALYQGLQDGSLGYEPAAEFKTHSLIERQLLDYPSVNPRILIYRRKDLVSAAAVPPAVVTNARTWLFSTTGAADQIQLCGSFQTGSRSVTTTASIFTSRQVSAASAAVRCGSVNRALMRGRKCAQAAGSPPISAPHKTSQAAACRWA